MAKTASIKDIEHYIEALPQSDQLILMEKIVQNLKKTILGTKSSKDAVIPDTYSLKGALKQYAKPNLRVAEEHAFAEAMKEKYAHN